MQKEKTGNYLLVTKNVTESRISTGIQIKLFSYTKQDAAVLLLIYNSTYLICSGLESKNPILSFDVALLATFVTLFIITINDFFEKNNEEKKNANEKDEELRKKLRDEYHRAYKIRKKGELLKKAIYSMDVDKDNPRLDHNDDFDSIKKVHFNFLDQINKSKPSEQT